MVDIFKGGHLEVDLGRFREKRAQLKALKNLEITKDIEIALLNGMTDHDILAKIRDRLQ